MKNYITLFLLLSSCVPCFNSSAEGNTNAPSYAKYMEQLGVTYNKNLELITHYKGLLKALLCQESGYGRNIVGDGGRALGPLQEHPCIVDDANMILGVKKYTYDDRMDLSKSIEMFLIYQEFYNPTRSIEKAARIWNGGPNAMKYTGTIAYWESVKWLIDNPKDELLAETLINSANIQAV